MADVYVVRSREQRLRQGSAQDEVVSLIDTILYDAITKRASDIHIEPIFERVQIRYRIDGELYEQMSLAYDLLAALISRLKVLAHLDIAEQRIPQDGKVRILCNSESLDLRIATFPSVHGEKIVVRILDKSKEKGDLNLLGLPDDIKEALIHLLRKPHGLFLVTGPTGSGKTTTLYALLSHFERSRLNIVTIEDPVEYEIEGVIQSQVHTVAGFTFENGLRSLLRQDPDIIMIGEIRDKPTVRIAVEASLTGHLVLSTLHTNDAQGAVIRLLDQGVEPFLIVAVLVGVLAQRLVRVLCNQCKERRSLSSAEQHLASQHGWDFDPHVWKARGCPSCRNTGYSARTGVFELLTLTDDFKESIIKGNVRRNMHGTKKGMRTLASDALDKLKAGTISFEEFLRISL